MVDDQVLYDLLDGKLSPREEEAIKARIESDVDLKIRWQFLQRLERDIKNQPLERTSLNFTDAVMESINHAGRSRISGNWGPLLVILAGTIMGLVILISGIPSFPVFAWMSDLSNQWISTTGNSVFHFLPNNELLVKIFVFADLFLVLFLLDRYLFRNLFRRHHQAF